SERRGVALAAAAAVVLLLSRAFVLSAAPYLPPALLAALTPTTAMASIRQTPRSLLSTVEDARNGFDRSPARTMIRTGRRVEATPAAAAAPAQGAPPPAAATPAPAPTTKFAAADAVTTRPGPSPLAPDRLPLAQSR